MNSCEKVGRVWDEEFRCGWAVYPTAAPLQNGTLRRCDCIRINCFIPDRVSVAGLSSVIEGMSCFPDFSSLASVICLFDAFHQNPSFWPIETPEHDEIFRLSRQACRLVLCQPSRKAKQSKAKSNMNQTPASSREKTYEQGCTQGKDKGDIWGAVMPEFRPVFILSFLLSSLLGHCGWWCPRGCSSCRQIPAKLFLVLLHNIPQRFFIVTSFYTLLLMFSFKCA